MFVHKIVDCIIKNYSLILADPIDWPLIASTIGLFALAASALCCWLCCRYLWFVCFGLIV
jgi:hypothetical protein